MHLHFDLLAPLYDRVLGSSRPATVIDVIQPGGERVLEVGGGTGRFVQHFTTYFDETWIVDPSQPMLAEAKAKHPKIRLINAFGDDIPTSGDFFDLVIIYDALHHFSNHRDVLKEIYRVVKPGGRLFIGDIHPHHHWGVVTGVLERVALMKSTFFTPQQLSDILSSVGFDVLGYGWINQPTYGLLAAK